MIVVGAENFQGVEWLHISYIYGCFRSSIYMIPKFVSSFVVWLDILSILCNEIYLSSVKLEYGYDFREFMNGWSWINIF